MAFDRESIERKDFSLVERGYDPGAVAARLSAIADEVEGLQRSSRGAQADTLAGAVSNQVRGIVEAAENSAAEILRGAELEAREIRAQASHAAERATDEAQRRHEQAASQAREHVGRISSSISQLLRRLEAIDGELHALTASLRTDTERLHEQLKSLVGELEGAVGGPGTPEAAAPVAGPKTPETALGGHASEPTAEPSPESAKIGDQPPGSEPPEAEAPHAPARGSSEDSEGARLIALNMALNGTSREETARYLAENYDLADRERLLDEVYASVQP